MNVVWRGGSGTDLAPLQALIDLLLALRAATRRQDRAPTPTS